MTSASSARTTYWLVFAMFMIAVVGIAAWQRMSLSDRRKLLGIS
jgi:hypothetical protein